MADTKVSALTALTGANLASGDKFPVVDVSDTSMAASGTDKAMTADELATGLRAQGSAWTTYTPTWGSSGTQPAIGNGTIAGAWFQVGKLLHVRIALQMGTTTTYGTGGWTLSLPAGKTSVNAGIGQTGHILTYDSSANAVSIGSASVGANSTSISLFTSSANMTGTAPWTWANGDQVIVQVTLEIQ